MGSLVLFRHSPTAAEKVSPCGGKGWLGCRNASRKGSIERNLVSRRFLRHHVVVKQSAEIAIVDVTGCRLGHGLTKQLLCILQARALLEPPLAGWPVRSRRSLPSRVVGSLGRSGLLLHNHPPPSRAPASSSPGRAVMLPSSGRMARSPRRCVQLATAASARTARMRRAPVRLRAITHLPALRSAGAFRRSGPHPQLPRGT